MCHINMGVDIVRAISRVLFDKIYYYVWGTVVWINKTLALVINWIQIPLQTLALWGKLAIHFKLSESHFLIYEIIIINLKVTIINTFNLVNTLNLCVSLEMLPILLRFLYVLHLSSTSEIHYWIMEGMCYLQYLYITNSLFLVCKKIKSH